MPETMAVRAGLFCRTKRVLSWPVPLEGVEVRAQIRDYASRVVVSQRYRNVETRPLEVVYVFPLDERAAVCGFEAVIDGTHVVGRVKERERAFVEYDDAMAAGQGAYLLDQERPDVFTASIGNLPPGREVLVRLTYVAELEREGDDIRFTLPTTVSPLYAPPEDRVGVGRSREATLNPEKAFTVPYGLELSVDIEMASSILGLESPTHPLSVEIRGQKACARLGETRTSLDRDFVLKIRRSEPDAPRAMVELDEAGRTFAALSFEPRLHGREAPGEYIFLLDRSGSMVGSSIAEARRALDLCLRSLRPSCTFNLVGFGSTHQSLFEESRPYDEASLAQAARHLAKVKADLGGTEILPALQSIFARRPQAERARQLFVLTDGQVTNTEEVIALVRRHSVEARVFTFGIGAGASAHLLRGMARAGEGEAEFIAPGERMDEKVMRQMKRAFTPALTSVTLDWGAMKATPAPQRLPPLFAGSRLVAYARLEEPSPGTVTLRADGPDGPVEFPLTLGAATPDDGSHLLATLWARAAIRDLEEGRSAWHDRRGSLQERAGLDRITSEIVHLGVTYGLVSGHTSFVAVEERATPVEGDAVLRRVPVALTRGWGEPGIFGVDLEPGSTSLGMPEAAPEGMSLSIGAAGVGSPSVDRLGRRPRPTLGAPPESVGMPSPRPPKVSLLDWFLGRKPAAAAPAAPGDPLLRLVQLQSANGSWELGPELAEVLGVDLPRLEAAIHGARGGDEARRAWATALALAWLLARPEDRTLWEMIADKARDWLAATAARPVGDLSFEEQAAAFLREARRG